jgi:hypothetical protein
VDVSQKNAAVLIAAIQESPMPLVVSAADLSVSAGANWNLTVDVTWLERPSSAR